MSASVAPLALGDTRAYGSNQHDCGRLCRANGALGMGDTINWGFFRRHFWGALLRHQDEAARSLVRRLRLPRQTANDGTVRINVDLAEIQYKPPPPGSEPRLYSGKLKGVKPRALLVGQLFLTRLPKRL